jgi:hypothetical protein
MVISDTWLALATAISNMDGAVTGDQVKLYMLFLAVFPKSSQLNNRACEFMRRAADKDKLFTAKFLNIRV